jgi:two-component system, OmpR family, sensor kinase
MSVLQARALQRLRRGRKAPPRQLLGREPNLLNSSNEPIVLDDVASELADLRRQVEELHQAVRARNDFISIAAHELRNPMTPLLGVAELALAAARAADGTCPPRVTSLLERMQLIVQDYVRRATRLLDVSRIEAGNLRLEPAVTDVSTLMRALAQRYDIPAARGRSVIEIDLMDGVVAVCDPLAVEQVAENLLSNALKFGLGKPVTLRLCLDDDGCTVRLEVEDRGLGMDPDQQKRIFGRFEQIMSQHRGSGFGVGLWVANQLISAMKGRIIVVSHLGEGSTFIVTFPLSPRTEPDHA